MPKKSINCQTAEACLNAHGTPKQSRETKREKIAEKYQKNSQHKAATPEPCRSEKFPLNLAAF